MAKLISSLGLMSGTSLDGVDVAHILTDGEQIVERRGGLSIPYTKAQTEALRQGLIAAQHLTDRTARPAALAALEADLTRWHAEAVSRFMREFHNPQIDLIGFHGQTILHKPQEKLTIQLGDGQMLAQLTGLAVVADMRAADVAAGGQGAPLVPAYHAALAGDLAASPCVFVNIGGVANITYIGTDGALMAFDTGPGNALLNDWALRHSGHDYDINGELAASGAVDEMRLASWLAHKYFTQKPPKSLDRNDFAHVDLEGLSPADGAACLTAFTARSIAKASEHFPDQPFMWVITGGGRRNPTLLTMLRKTISGMVVTAEEAGLDGDLMEAEAWAYLAARSSLGLPLSFPGTTGVFKPMRGGVRFEA